MPTFPLISLYGLNDAVLSPCLAHHFGDLTNGAQRLSLNFRFKQGNSLLDNERKEQQSRVISRFRALAVRAALMQRNVPVFGIEGFDAFLPVAGNPELAAAKNGRVEVWLGPAG